MQPIKSEIPGREIYWGFLLLSKRTINSNRKSPVEKSTGGFVLEKLFNRYKLPNYFSKIVCTQVAHYRCSSRNAGNGVSR
jgi:hypothetical protein